MPERSLSRDRRPATSRALAVVVVAALAFAVAPGCDTRTQPPPAHLSNQAPTAEKGSAGLDLHTVMRNAHFAFRPDGAGFRGGHITYAARFDGALSVTPRDPSRPDAPAPSAFTATVASIERGAARLDEGASTDARAEASGSLAVRRGAVIERLENDDDGVEQSFVFASASAGQGDLTVHLRVSGEEFVGATASGLHFADRAAGLGVRYGGAVWVDARNARTPLVVTREAEGLAITVPAAVLERSAFPAVLDPTIGPEQSIDTPVVIPAVNTQIKPAAAFGQSSTLVVWQDYRDSVGTNNAYIYGARVSPSGTVLDPSGIPVAVPVAAGPGGDRRNPVVAFDGTDWMVAWWNASAGWPAIQAARVTTAGVVLDPAGIAVVPSNGSYPAIACGAGTCAIAFTGASGIQAVTVSPGGVVTSGAPIQVTTAAGFPPAIAFNGTNFLLGATTVRRMSPAGAVLDATDIQYYQSSGSLFSVRIASDGTNWLVGYVDWYGMSIVRIFTQVVSSSGAIVGSPVDLYSTTMLANPTFDLRFGGGQYVLAFAYPNNGDIQVTNAMNVPSTPPLPSGFENPALAFDGTNFLVAFDDSTHVRAARATPAQTWIDNVPFLISGQANTESNLSVAFNGANYLAVWQDARSGSTTQDIYGARITPAGTVLDQAGLPVAQAAGAQLTPSVVSNGTDWLAAWQDGRNGYPQIYASRVSAGGAVVDPMGIPIPASGNTSQNPAVASDGANYLVAWNLSNGSTAQAARVSSAGTVLDATAIAVPFSAARVALGNNGANYLVAGTYQNKVTATRISTAGAVLDAAGIPVSTAAAGATLELPSVTSDGTNWLVAWDTTTHVVGARVGPTGTVLDPSGIAITSAANTQTSPSVGWDGTTYWAAWQDSRATAGHFDIYGARISGAGTVTDPGGIVISTNVENQLLPVIAGGPQNELLVAYQRFDPAQPYGGVRARYRLVSSIGCTLGSDCASGFCVDGMCCNTACTGTCQGCSYAVTGLADGTCGNVKNGTDPHMSCPPSGLSCATATCENGACGQLVAAGSCLVAGACYAANAPSPSNPCQTCQPAVSQTTFSSLPDGTACPSDGVSCHVNACQGGVCTHTLLANECLIGGTCEASGAANPLNPCQVCAPAQSTSAWSNEPDGTACPSDGISCHVNQCMGGACAHTLQPATCLIAGACVAEGTQNPINDCQSCQSAVSTTSWSTKPDGASCTPSSKSCLAALCMAGACTHPQLTNTCLVGGVCYKPGDKDPADSCQDCSPGDSMTAWTPIPGCVPDAGPGDAGPGDAGPGDAGSGDAGPSDAGPSDAGPSDAGPSDAGPADAGDAGPGDAGPGDAGTGGSGTGGGGTGDGGTDGGGTGGGGTGGGAATSSSSGTGGEPGPDAGTGHTPGPKGGCGCRLEAASETGSALPFAGLAALLVLRRRRRRIDKTDSR
jgi:hypothetical protein